MVVSKVRTQMLLKYFISFGVRVMVGRILEVFMPTVNPRKYIPSIALFYRVQRSSSAEISCTLLCVKFGNGFKSQGSTATNFLHAVKWNSFKLLGKYLKILFKTSTLQLSNFTFSNDRNFQNCSPNSCCETKWTDNSRNWVCWKIILTIVVAYLHV